ncbi:hypothetical protein B9Z19DRAFT_1066874 [Tuber borchii]|uniref:Uncharacterized protein n=1 Tax=Tuber borchii TaxID=42251 RepID=A0A2T6ZL46_TUBBO|nr:hypothetical protein B9Z19DRAFT_1066874 [Tuber borchii]
MSTLIQCLRPYVATTNLLIEYVATTSIAEASMEEFQTRTFGPDHSITLNTMSFGRMKADFSFYLSGHMMADHLSTSLDNYSHLQLSLFSHPYLYSPSWGHKVIHFIYMMDFAKAGMHTPVLGQMYWLGVKIHEDKSVNVELQWQEMVSGLFDYDNTEYEGINAALGAGI